MENAQVGIIVYIHYIFKIKEHIDTFHALGWDCLCSEAEGRERYQNRMYLTSLAQGESSQLI